MATEKDPEHFAPSDLVETYDLKNTIGWRSEDLGHLLKVGLLRGNRNSKGVTLIHEESLLSLLKYRNQTLEKSKFELNDV